jgi:two-component system response regulator AtoC
MASPPEKAKHPSADERPTTSTRPGPAGASTDLEDEDWNLLNTIILGQSPEIIKVKRIISRVAKTDVTVLLRGESGTGKELAAQALYRSSHRRNKPFVKVLCAAIPEGLLESEFFGFERGSFTGAHRRNPGKFEFANNGTIFLDEIGDIPQSLQAKLLQVLQDGEFSRIGGQEVKVDTRVIAATNRNLEKAVHQGVFREDLFYRLNVVSIVMPPLRKRKEDIPLLTEFFLQKYSHQYNRDFPKISSETMEKILSYPWPGNIREMENLVKRMIVLGSDQIDFPSSLDSTHNLTATPQQMSSPIYTPPPSSIPVPSSPTTHPPENLGTNDPPITNLKEVARLATRKAEEETIRRVLEETRWNRRKAAKILGISYKTLLQKLKMCNLEG